MQIRIIIEHKYSSSYQKSTTIVRKEKREFLYPFLQIKRETEISRTHPRLRVIGRINTGWQGINKKIWTRRGEGRVDYHLKEKEGVEDRNLDSYQVRCSKHGLLSRFKVNYELMPVCWLTKEIGLAQFGVIELQLWVTNRDWVMTDLVGQ